MAVTDAVAAAEVLGGPDSFANTNPDILARDRRRALSTQIRSTQAERIFDLGQNQTLPAITAVGRSVNAFA
ncbi:MAG: hypothetical protein JKX97_01370 [Candidatus Lindowbacteria bacterium]|nr:hypothetical protein [Candidatus Lindowbacteria bacterium]